MVICKLLQTAGTTEEKACFSKSGCLQPTVKDILGILCLFLPTSFLGIRPSEPRMVLSMSERKKSYFSFSGNMHIEFVNMITIFREAELLMKTDKMGGVNIPPCFILLPCPFYLEYKPAQKSLQNIMHL